MHDAHARGGVKNIILHEPTVSRFANAVFAAFVPSRSDLAL
jgi:hypothetical protein